ncbi:MAG TPA: carbamoyl-phosphate synthase large subunit, partial [Candidatus Deferrimicrobiaceae bacterium]|nr:carbamoyl-phosphate synthase large subunit [Candidatus Deferrimicrobiaceae bacterium]
MPRRDDIQKILIIGSGPIIIGQACEFDYSGTQACKALKKLGYGIVLVNSNPATIMTDPTMADVTYIEPLNVASLTEIIEKERPDALLPNLGGQTGLNLSSALAREGVLDKYGVKVIGVNIDAIQRGEDRQEFKSTMSRLGLEMPRSDIAHSLEEAEAVVRRIGFPVVIRPAYTLGGTGGGFAYNVEEFRTIVARGLSMSLVGQVLVEESVLGWEELELEVVRDAKGQKITVCFIENVDAMGVHTGDSYCTAPMLTIAPELQERLQKHSYDIVDAIGVIGGTNVQFAHDPATGRVVIIEINPRTSRSSALASKATGFPIAFVSSLLACGLTLDEIPYWREGTLEKYTPWGDYVVVKFARWAFEKFKGVQDKLGTQMRAVGEVMSIGKTYKEAFQKSIRSLEIGRYGMGFARDFHSKPVAELMSMLAEPSSERQFLMYEAIRKGATTEELHAKTHIKPWFIEQMRELVALEERMLEYKGRRLPDDLLIQAKKDGFADRYLAMILGVPEEEIRRRRTALGIVEAWDAVPVSGVENAAYYYSTYNGPDRVETSGRRKVLVLGGGPNRIGQGIEFDYCCVHAAFALRDAGYESIMINCNPETVSTDYDTSDKLYFEPLTVEDVLAIHAKEKPEGVIVQFGGQTPLNLAKPLEAAGVPIIGTSVDSIDIAEDRKRFAAV